MAGFWNTKAGGYVTLAGIGAVIAWWLYHRAAAATAAAATALNPLNPGNVAYGGVNSIGEALTGDSYWTAGGWLYDVTHGAPATPAQAAENPAYSIVNRAGQSVSGDPYWSLGGWVYDVTHADPR